MVVVGDRKGHHMRRLLIALALITGALLGVRGAEAAPRIVDVCPPQPAGFARCLAEVVVDDAYTASADGPVEGYSPADIKTAYGIRGRNGVGSGKTIAIVTAFDAPAVENDLKVFSAQFGLPSCTTANGCFTKVYARGAVPAVDPGWALETSLDVEIAHGIAPSAKIILVEGSTNNYGDLFQAYDVARLTAARYISNSWGGVEFEQQTIFDPLFDNPGKTTFFGSGDTGAVPVFPSVQPSVVSVGGTRLVLNSANTMKSERVWTSAGSGCSQIYSASAPQLPFSQGFCGTARATPDIAGNADPQTGYAIYDSTPAYGQVGWRVVGGTSASTPVMAARAADTGAVWDAAYLYSSQRKYFDVKLGSNGFPAGPGFDLATGRGRYGA
jgi:subtilase family serine protease